MSEVKEIKNDLYHDVIVSGFSIGYAMLLKKVFKVSTPDLGKVDFSDSVKLVGIVAVSIFTKEYLVKKKIIPENM